jgi:hypothetical protein
LMSARRCTRRRRMPRSMNSPVRLLHVSHDTLDVQPAVRRNLDPLVPPRADRGRPGRLLTIRTTALLGIGSASWMSASSANTAGGGRRIATDRSNVGRPEGASFRVTPGFAVSMRPGLKLHISLSRAIRPFVRIERWSCSAFGSFESPRRPLPELLSSAAGPSLAASWRIGCAEAGS